MLAKTGNDSSNYTINRFRTQFSDSNFRCSMAAQEAKSDWQENYPNRHWIVKELSDTFKNENGGYLTMTVDFKTTTLSLYWNGKFVDSTVCDYEWMVNGGLKDNTIPFNVGRLVAGDEATSVYIEYYAKMDLYACRLYNKVLTDEEIKQNCEKTVAYHNLLVQESN